MKIYLIIAKQTNKKIGRIEAADQDQANDFLAEYCLKNELQIIFFKAEPEKIK